MKVVGSAGWTEYGLRNTTLAGDAFRKALSFDRTHDEGSPSRPLSCLFVLFHVERLFWFSDKAWQLDTWPSCVCPVCAALKGLGMISAYQPRAASPSKSVEIEENDLSKHRNRTVCLGSRATARDTLPVLLLAGGTTSRQYPTRSSSLGFASSFAPSLVGRLFHALMC
jgi:hypothetical protein